MAQQKLAKQLKLNTNNDAYMRYGQQNKGGSVGISSTNAGNITTTAKSGGPSLFNFTQAPQNISGYSVGGLNQDTRTNGGASIRRGQTNNKQRSHSSSNQAAINQSNIVFVGNQAEKDKSHNRNNSDIQNGARRHDEFIKEQKMQAAEHAITDQYA